MVLNFPNFNSLSNKTKSKVVPDKWSPGLLGYQPFPPLMTSCVFPTWLCAPFLAQHWCLLLRHQHESQGQLQQQAFWTSNKYTYRSCIKSLSCSNFMYKPEKKFSLIPCNVSSSLRTHLSLEFLIGLTDQRGVVNETILGRVMFGFQGSKQSFFGPKNLNCGGRVLSQIQQGACKRGICHFYIERSGMCDIIIAQTTCLLVF